MHYYQFNIPTWILHTSHLTLEEECVYRRLLDFYYDTEKPIPRETKPVIRRLRLVNYEDIVDQILGEFFVLEDDGWHNSRADIEISEYQSRGNRARENGKKGGRPKKESGLETQSVILANPEETTSKANYKLLTNNQELNISTSESPTHDPVDPLLNCPHKAIIEIYHRILPELPRVLDTTWKGSSREKDLQARWRHDKRHQNLDFWEAYFEGVARSKFHLGDNNRGWKADLGWLVKRSNFDKMVERIQAEII